MKAMELMGYDALNMGSSELYFGKEFLEHTRSRVSFPYIASNLLYGGSRLPWTREYIIKEVGGIKVAILGILDPDDLKKIPRQDDVKGFEVISLKAALDGLLPEARGKADLDILLSQLGKAENRAQDDVKGFEVIPPKAALDRLLPEARGKADLVILLSQLGEAENHALVEAAQGIDVVITSAYNETLSLKPPENTVILNAVSNGIAMGLVTIMLDDKRVLSVSERRNVPLDRSVPDNEEISGLVETYKETYKKEQEIKKEKMERELMEGLQLTPEEFMERYQKKQTEQKKGEAQ